MQLVESKTGQISFANTYDIRPRDLAPNAYLTNFAVDFGNKMDSFIADKVAPRYKVDEQKIKYKKYDRGEAFRFKANQGLWVRGTRTDEVLLSGTDVEASCESYGMHVFIHKHERGKNYINTQLRKTKKLEHSFAMVRELRLATLLRDTNNVGAGHFVTLAGNDQWSSTNAASQPFDDLKTAAEAIINDTGQAPNFYIIPYSVAIALLNHSTFTDRYKYWKSTSEHVALPPIFDMEPIIAKARYNSAAMNAAATQEPIWGKDVICAYIEGLDLLDEETCHMATTFDHADMSGVFSWYDNGLSGDFIQREEMILEKIIGEFSFYIIKDAIA